MRLGVLLPHTKLYGGVKRFLELGNIFVEKGHEFYVFTPDGTPPDWFSYKGRMATFSDVQGMELDALWKNTLVIMLPDHRIVYQNLDESNPLLNHIPMIWVGGAVKAPKRIEQICNQADLPATLLGQLGLNHDTYTFSRDVLSKTYTKPVAIHTYDDGFTMIDSTSFVNYDFISDRMVKGDGTACQRLIRQAQAILQAAPKDLNER